MAKTPEKSVRAAEKANDGKARRAAKPKPDRKKPATKPAKKAQNVDKLPKKVTNRLPNVDSLPSKKKGKAAPAATDSAEAERSVEPKGRKKQPRKAHETRPTPEEEAKIIERRWRVWELYKATGNYRAVAAHLKATGEERCSLGTVFADVKWCLDQQHKDLKLDVEQHVENEVAIINDVHSTFYLVMKDPKMPLDIRDAAADKVITCVKERAKLRNLYKPRAVRILNKDEFAAALGLSEEELPDDDDADRDEE